MAYRVVLTRAEAQILLHLSDCGRMPQLAAEIARDCGLSLPTTYKAIRRLKEVGCVEDGEVAVYTNVRCLLSERRHISAKFKTLSPAGVTLDLK